MRKGEVTQNKLILYIFLRFVEPKSEYYTYFFSAFKKILKNAIQKFIHIYTIFGY